MVSFLDGKALDLEGWPENGNKKIINSIVAWYKQKAKKTDQDVAMADDPMSIWIAKKQRFINSIKTPTKPLNEEQLKQVAEWQKDNPRPAPTKKQEKISSLTKSDTEIRQVEEQ